MIYSQEESRYAVPRGYFEIGLGMCIPTMIAYATPAQLHTLSLSNRRDSLMAAA